MAASSAALPSISVLLSVEPSCFSSVLLVVPTRSVNDALTTILNAPDCETLTSESPSGAAVVLSSVAVGASDPQTLSKSVVSDSSDCESHEGETDEPDEKKKGYFSWVCLC